MSTSTTSGGSLADLGRPRRRRSAADAVGAQRPGARRLRHARWPHDHSGTGRLPATAQPRNARPIPDNVFRETGEREGHHRRHWTQPRRLPRLDRRDVDTHAPLAELSGHDPADHVCGADRRQWQLREILNELFPSARRFQNTLDVIPLAYYNLNLIDSIYGGLLPTPDFVKVGLALMQESIAAVGYTQPAQGQQILPGTQLASDTDWDAPALRQPHPATFLATLTGMPVDTSALPQPSVARAKKARLVELIASAASKTK